MERIYIKGVKGKGRAVLKELISRGGKLTGSNWSGECTEAFYFINTSGQIDYTINETFKTLLAWTGKEIKISPKTNKLKEWEPVLVSDKGTCWDFAAYKEGNEVYLMHLTEGWETATYKYIVPYNKFNFKETTKNIKNSIT